MAKKEVYNVGLTGGPCAGKTTGVSTVIDEFMNYGIQTIVIPEVATELFLSGVTVGDNGLSRLEFQRQVFRMQIERHRRYNEIARALKSPKVLLLSDRGLMDLAGYMPWFEFLVLLESEGYSLVETRDSFHEAIIHLDTALEPFYTTVNNKARKETWAEAMEVNERIKRVWTGHPHQRVIESSTDFEGKIKRLVTAICRVLGLPIPVEIERRFLVTIPDWNLFRELAKPQEIDVEQVYLISSEDGQRRVRKRGQFGSHIYFETIKRSLRDRMRIEQEWRIDPLRYYEAATKEHDPHRSPVKKTRYCFLWKNQYFELDRFYELEKQCHAIFGQNDPTILEIELTEENDAISIPDFIKVEREVTGEEKYSNASIALKT